MEIDFLLPNGTLSIDHIQWSETSRSLQIAVRCRQDECFCPRCGCPAARVHSRYHRRLQDLPWSEHRIEIHLTARRFFCDNPACCQRIFAERFPEFVRPYRRFTIRLANLMQHFGLLLGGTSSVQVLHLLSVTASRWTVLREVRKTKLPIPACPRVLGIDDWALRRGHRYGTLLVDMETHRMVDLLPDREADTVTRWLEVHPEVQVISRDRSGAYAQAARQGAPQALQVADRWHLFANLGEALTTFLRQHRRALKQISGEYVETVLPCGRSPAHERRLARFRAARQLRDTGLTVAAIAHQLQLDRKTVRKYIQATAPPSGRRRRKETLALTPYEDYLLRHGLDGHRTVRQLWRDLQAQGFAGSLTTVATFLATARHPPMNLPVPLPSLSPASNPPGKLTPRRATWLLLSPPQALTDAQHQQVQQLVTIHPDVAQMATEVQAFASLLREQQVEAFDDWLQRALHASIRELRSFARGILRDYDAVRAALSLPWSNGLVEGQVNRLKFVKRQMFGRAKFDLLRLRVLARDPP